MPGGTAVRQDEGTWNMRWVAMNVYSSGYVCKSALDMAADVSTGWGVGELGSSTCERSGCPCHPKKHELEM